MGFSPHGIPRRAPRARNLFFQARRIYWKRRKRNAARAGPCTSAARTSSVGRVTVAVGRGARAKSPPFFRVGGQKLTKWAPRAWNPLPRAPRALAHRLKIRSAEHFFPAPHYCVLRSIENDAPSSHRRKCQNLRSGTSTQPPADPEALSSEKYQNLKPAARRRSGVVPIYILFIASRSQARVSMQTCIFSIAQLLLEIDLRLSTQPSVF